MRGAAGHGPLNLNACRKSSPLYPGPVRFRRAASENLEIQLGDGKRAAFWSAAYRNCLTPCMRSSTTPDAHRRSPVNGADNLEVCTGAVASG